MINNPRRLFMFLLMTTAFVGCMLCCEIFWGRPEMNVYLFFCCQLLFQFYFVSYFLSLCTFLHLVMVTCTLFDYNHAIFSHLSNVPFLFFSFFFFFFPQRTTRTTPKGILRKPPQLLHLRSRCGGVLSLRPRPRPRPRFRASRKPIPQ